MLKIHSPDILHKSDVGGVRLSLQNADMVASAYDDMMRHVRALRPRARIEGAVVQPMLRFPDTREVLVGVTTDPVFGPVVSFGTGGVAVEAVADTAVALPPLNGALARELMGAHRRLPSAGGLPQRAAGRPRRPRRVPGRRLAHRLHAALGEGDGLEPGACASRRRGRRRCARSDRPRRAARAGAHYPHMAIHPYPIELEGELRLRDGRTVRVRPIRPEDAARELRFFERLSDRSRFQRFMQYLRELSPRMLARFTQLDYDRELALVALWEGEFVAVGRYAPNADGETAEFALAVADDWQGKGLGHALLERLCDAARAAGYRALYGHILDANREMLELARHLGFVDAARDGSEVTVVRKL